MLFMLLGDARNYDAPRSEATRGTRQARLHLRAPSSSFPVQSTLSRGLSYQTSQVRYHDLRLRVATVERRREDPQKSKEDVNW